MNIATTRADLVAYLAGALPTTSVLGYFPDDVAEVPCVVVGRPTINLNGALASMALPVVGIGRRLGDEDSQGELDRLGDALLSALSVGPPGFSSKRLGGLDPTVTTVAAIDFPSYTAQLTFDYRYC